MTPEPTTSVRVDEDGKQTNTLVETETFSLLASWDRTATSHAELDAALEVRGQELHHQLSTTEDLQGDVVDRAVRSDGGGGES